MVRFLQNKGYSIDEFDPSNTVRRSVPSVSGYYAVIHLGAISDTRCYDLNQLVENNFNFSADLYKKCWDAGVKFQYASSASVYGLSSSFQESQFCKPACPYALSKYMFDLWVQNEPYPSQGFRYFNVYGDGEEHKGDQASPVHKFTQQARENGVIDLFSGSENYFRDFVWVEDVCDVHWRALEKPNGGVYNVGTGFAESFRKIACAIAIKHTAIIREIPMPTKLQRQYQTFTQSDNTQLIGLTGKTKWKNVIDYIND